MDPKLQHTPGPWKQSCESIDPDWHIVTTSGGAVIANVFAPQNANAHLIAAAPDLLDALEALRHAVCGETGFAACVRKDSGRAYPWPALDEAEAIVEAAIAKARGQE